MTRAEILNEIIQKTKWVISLCINRHWTHSCSLECGSSDSSSEKRVGMAPSAYLLPSTYYTKLELQVYFLIPQLDSSILSSKMVLFITVSILSSYVQHLLHSEGILSKGTCLLIMSQGWLHIRTCVLGALSSGVSQCPFLIIHHPLYVDHYVILLMFIMQVACQNARLRRNIIMQEERYEDFFI